MTADKCPIWGTPATIQDADQRDLIVVKASSRAGGDYYILESAKGDLYLHRDDSSLKVRLTTWLVDQRLLGTASPEITREIIEQARQRQPLPVQDRADRLLKYLAKSTTTIGSTVVCNSRDPNDPIFSEMLAWTQSNSFDELTFLLEYLISKGWTTEDVKPQLMHYTVITVDGYTRLAELATKQINSSQGFVAMWFDDSMTEAYENGIGPGIEDAGYKPLRIDKKEHINKIDDEIIAEIRRSRFVVADFTEGEKGNRGGVYYEAGFAHGLNIPVIFTCRKDSMNHLHFDTRQFPHIVWNTPDDLRTQLAARISAVIGDGPHRKQP